MRQLLLIGSLTALSALATAADSPLITYTQPWSAFSFQAPPGWKQDTKSDLLVVESPDGAVTVTASSLRKQGGTLRQFADQRFAAVPAFNKQVGQEKAIAGGFLREYEGVWPGDKELSYYAVSARESGSGFVSMSIVTDREDFEKNRATYLRILESGRAAP
jgi:hypothetical protein